MIRSSALSTRSPQVALSMANQAMLQGRRADLFLTAFYAVLDLETGQLTFSNAGHNPPLLFRPSTGRLHELRSKGIVLGIFRSIELEDREVVLEPGDYLVLYTDGVTEAMDADKQLFGLKRLEAAIRSSAGSGAKQVQEAIVQNIRSFTGDIPQSDDLTLLIVHREE